MDNTVLNLINRARARVNPADFDDAAALPNDVRSLILEMAEALQEKYAPLFTLCEPRSGASLMGQMGQLRPGVIVYSQPDRSPEVFGVDYAAAKQANQHPMAADLAREAADLAAATAGEVTDLRDPIRTARQILDNREIEKLYK